MRSFYVQYLTPFRPSTSVFSRIKWKSFGPECPGATIPTGIFCMSCQKERADSDSNTGHRLKITSDEMCHPEVQIDQCKAPVQHATPVMIFLISNSGINSLAINAHFVTSCYVPILCLPECKIKNVMYSVE